MWVCKKLYYHKEKTKQNKIQQNHMHIWWDILMMTSSNGNIFRVTGPLCGEFTGPGEFPTQRPVTQSFDVFFDLRLNKRLSKQPWSWWFETPSWSWWRQCNVYMRPHTVYAAILHSFPRALYYCLGLMLLQACELMVQQLSFESCTAIGIGARNSICSPSQYKDVILPV